MLKYIFLIIHIPILSVSYYKERYFDQQITGSKYHKLLEIIFIEDSEPGIQISILLCSCLWKQDILIEEKKNCIIKGRKPWIR